MKTNYILIALLAFFTVACETDHLYDEDISVYNKIPLSEGLALEMGPQTRIDFLAVSQKSVQQSTIFTPQKGEQILRIVAGPEPTDPSQLFVYTAPIDARESELAPALTRVSCPSGNLTRFPIGSYFGQMEFSEDKQFAVLYHGADDFVGTSGLYNPNEVAILDLTKDPSDSNPQIVSIDIQGHTIERIEFIEPIQIGTVKRRLVSFITDGLLKLTDLDDPSTPSVSVSLKQADDNRLMIATKFVVVPAKDNRDPRLLVLATNSKEIFDISLIESDDGFDARLNMLDGGPSPSDIITVSDGDLLMLVVANRSGGRINVVDVDTSAYFTVNLDDSMEVIFERDHNGQNELVMYGAQTNAIYLVNTEDLASERGSAFEKLTIPSGINTASQIDDNRLLVDPYTNEGLIIVDLRSRTLTHISSGTGYDWHQATVWNETFFLHNSESIAYLNLETGHPQLLTLDEFITDFFIFDSIGLGMAFHPTPTGRATLFPLDSPQGQDAYTVDGFFVSGILNREVK